MCKFKENKEDGALVELLEYSKKEAWIQSTIMSRKKVYKVTKALKEGKNEVFQVIRCDRKKGFIDLSKKQVTDVEEIKEIEEHFYKAKTVQSILNYFANKTGKSLEDMCKLISFPLYQAEKSPYDHLKNTLSNPALLDAYNFSADEKETLMIIIKHRLSPPPVKIKAELKITCIEFNGVQLIREALLKASEVRADNIELKYITKGGAVYECFTETIFAKEGLKLIKDSIKVLEEEILARKGKMQVFKEPKILGQHEKTDVDDQINMAIEEEDEEQEQDEGIKEAEVVLNN